MSPSIKFMEKYSANYDGLVLLWGISRSSAALFPGTKKELVQELEAWLDRRQRHEKEVKELRMRSQASSQYLHDATKDIPSHKKAAVLRTMEQGEKDTARVEEHPSIEKSEKVRGLYLVESLKHKGVALPDHNNTPNSDMMDTEVCTALAAVGIDLDVEATLRELKDEEGEAQLLARREELRVQREAMMKEKLGS